MGTEPRADYQVGSVTQHHRKYPDAWIQTYTGRQFWPLEPAVEDVSITDITHALSMLCRFGGHSRSFYSVAEHCINVTLLAVRRFPEILPIHALLHDAAEAYLVDLPSPIKHELPVYQEAEHTILRVIFRGLDVPYPAKDEWDRIHEVDQIILASEREVLHHPIHDWPHLHHPPDPFVQVLGFLPAKASRLWMTFLDVILTSKNIPIALEDAYRAEVSRG